MSVNGLQGFKQSCCRGIQSTAGMWWCSPAPTSGFLSRTSPSQQVADHSDCGLFGLLLPRRVRNTAKSRQRQWLRLFPLAPVSSCHAGGEHSTPLTPQSDPGMRKLLSDGCRRHHPSVTEGWTQVHRRAWGSVCSAWTLWEWPNMWLHPPNTSAGAWTFLRPLSGQELHNLNPVFRGHSRTHSAGGQV